MRRRYYYRPRAYVRVPGGCVGCSVLVLVALTWGLLAAVAWAMGGPAL